MTVQDLTKHFTATVPQTEAASPLQQENNAGGFSFVLDDWGRLDRFLILGSEGGTYYVSARKFTLENAEALSRCLAADPARAVAKIVNVSVEGRAPKNDQAIFALAVAAAHPNKDARKLALAALPQVCRIGTHLFQFVGAVKEMRGFGRGLRKAVAKWYDKSERDLAFQMLKYQNRDGWNHSRVLRLSHATIPPALARWALGADAGPRAVDRRQGGLVEYPAAGELPALLVAYEEMKHPDTTEARAVALLREFRMGHEMVPSRFKGSADVWSALSEHMPLGALVRNLAKLTASGVLAPLSEATKRTVARLTDEDQIRKARIHPMGVLTALSAYDSGYFETQSYGAPERKSSLVWTAVPAISKALENAFHLAFGNVEPSGKNLLLALDVSGSMGWSFLPRTGLSARQAAAAMALVTARTEPNVHIVAFSHQLVEVGIRGDDTLRTALRKTKSIRMGYTDVALPFVFAKEWKLDVDGFVTYTDNETYFGTLHPHVALERYRKSSGKAAKSVVVGMTATEFTVADPGDTGSMDVVGFDAAAPKVISQFIAGE